MIRKPDYESGRFFISPILGCNARCNFCYIYNKGYGIRAIKNNFDINQVIDYLQSHPSFKNGTDGSIISIGAWGDPFPAYNKDLCSHSLYWLQKISFLGNPIQIMSRYELPIDIIDGIIKANKYYGHIMYSTSISSIENFRKIEPYSDLPLNRLKTIKLLNESDIATNVMIKPFIDGITDLEADIIAKSLIEYNVKQCVVGNLLLDETIKEKLISTGLLITKDNPNKQILDCTSGENYELYTSNKIYSFSEVLSNYNIKVFKKSSCVNSYILNKINPANYIKLDPNNYCINCGVCK